MKLTAEIYGRENVLTGQVQNGNGGNRMKGWKKGIVTILCAAILVGVCGCGKQEANDNNLLEPQRGRYVETQEILPEEVGEWSIKQIFTANDELHLLAAKKEGEKITLRIWAKQGDGFADVTPGWLAAMGLECEDWAEVQFLQSSDGVQYLFARYTADGNYVGHLWRSEEHTSELQSH